MWCVKMGEYMVLGSIVGGSDYHLASRHSNGWWTEGGGWWWPIACLLWDGGGSVVGGEWCVWCMTGGWLVDGEWRRLSSWWMLWRGWWVGNTIIRDRKKIPGIWARFDVQIRVQTGVSCYTQGQSGMMFIVCVLHIQPFFLPVDMQHTLCPYRFFILERYKLCGNKTMTQGCFLYNNIHYYCHVCLPSDNVLYMMIVHVPLWHESNPPINTAIASLPQYLNCLSSTVLWPNKYYFSFLKALIVTQQRKAEGNAMPCHAIVLGRRRP